MALSSKLRNNFVLTLAFEKAKAVATVFHKPIEDALDVPKDLDSVVVKMLQDETATFIIDCRSIVIGVNIFIDILFHVIFR